MKNVIKIFLICTIFIIFFPPNNAIGFFPYKDEEGTQNIHSTRRQSDTETAHSPSDNYSLFETFWESVSFLTNSLMSSFLGSNDDTVSTAILKRNNNTSITNCNNVNPEEWKKDNSTISDASTIAQKNPIIPLIPETKELNRQNTQSLSLSPHLETQESTTDAENKKACSNIKPKNIDYTQQISLGQKKGIRLPKKPYEEYIPIIETLIQKVIQDKIEIPVKVHVLVDFNEHQNFSKAFEDLVNTYTKYPSQFSWSKGNKGYTKGDNPCSICELTLVSHAKKREQVENEFSYHISDEDRQCVNWDYVYDIAMRSNFTLEDFQYNNRIKIRLLDCQDDTEKKVLEEFQQFLEQTLAKDHNPFHIIGITFNPNVKKDQGDMLGSFLGKVSTVNLGVRTRGTICDSTNGLLYLCLDNMHRRRLDLHGKRLLTGEYEGRSVKIAEEETKEFILQAYKTFQEDVTVCTGRGNHVNGNKTKGALKIAFNDWMKDEEISPLIKKSILCQGDGEYKVIFVKTCHLDLTHTKPQNIVSAIKKTVVQMVEQNNKRLRIALEPDAETLTENREFNLLLRFYADLKENDPQFAELLLPISCESTPGEMKIIFNQYHPKSRWSFTFFNSYGSKGFYGTIRKQGD